MLRFAPSPIGDMSIDSLRIAILNYLTAQQTKKQFLIRIDDNDSERNIEGKDTEIMMVLEKFALKHEHVFHQSQHLNLHQTLALRLLKEKKAFICTCTKEELENEPYLGECETLTQKDYTTLKASGEKFLIRLKKTKVASEVDNFVILKSNGIPSNNFACAVDDMMSNIDFIIRGEEHLLNTAKQIHIKNLLAYDNETTYVHIPNMQNAKEISVKWLFEEGFIPNAILNYLLLLGNATAPKEIFTLPEAIEWFDLNSIAKETVTFDIEALRIINREHLKMIEDKELSTLFGFADADIGKLAKVYLEECATTNELEAKIRAIFKAKDFSIQNGKEMRIIADIIADAPYFETFEQLKQHIKLKSKLESEQLSQALRLLLTGANNGPELSKVYPFIKSYILEVAS